MTKTAPKRPTPRLTKPSTTAASRQDGGASCLESPAAEAAARAAPSKLQRLIDLLSRPDGATLGEMTEVTGWQAHSVRGALAGSLKGKGHTIVSTKTDDVRRYRIAAKAEGAVQ